MFNLARPPIVLVVDDYDDTRDMLFELLTGAGFPTFAASDGAEAIERARELGPRLMLLDLSLPTVSGWEVARTLKADPATQDICIVACTAHVHARERLLALAAGCSLVLLKPLDLDEVLDVARTVLVAPI